MASPAFAAASAGVAVILARDEKLGTVATGAAAAAGGTPFQIFQLDPTGLWRIQGT